MVRKAAKEITIDTNDAKIPDTLIYLKGESQRQLVMVLEDVSVNLSEATFIELAEQEIPRIDFDIL